MARRFWFWRPQWYWYGWSTLLPIHPGSDEYGQRTLMLGWTITGRVIIAVGRRAQHLTALDDVMADLGIMEADLDG